MKILTKRKTNKQTKTKQKQKNKTKQIKNKQINNNKQNKNKKPTTNKKQKTKTKTIKKKTNKQKNFSAFLKIEVGILLYSNFFFSLSKLKCGWCRTTDKPFNIDLRHA